MDKKTIILAVLCIVLAFAWPSILHQFYPTPKPVPVVQSSATGEVAQATAVVAPTNQSPTIGEKPAVEPTATAKKPDTPKPPEQEAVLENDLVRVEFTSYGGGIRRVVLKKHREGAHDPDPVVLNRAVSASNSVASAPMGEVSGLPGIDRETTYTMRQDGPAMICEAVNADGLRLTKEYRLGSDYLIEGTFSVANQGRDALKDARMQIAMGTSSAMVPSDTFDIPYLIWGDGKTTESVDPSTFESSWWARRTARDVIRFDNVPLVWAGLEDRFFCVLWMPEAKTGSLSSVRKLVQHPGHVLDPNKPRPTDWGIDGQLISPAFNLAAGETYKYPFKLYAGPKDYKRLQKFDQGQTAVMHWGWFEWIAELLLKTMGLLHKIAPNYFFVIIIITIIIKLLFWPLTAMSNRSMKGMQALSPKMTALREKFKDEPQKLNAEMMKLYKEHKVNPMAGCLPTVVQIPVFIGFYYMLRSAIELRMDGFLWIHDLSQPDTIAHIAGFALNPLPILMGATMIWQMKITPSAGDPMQQKMMMFMPLMFLFFCYGMPSGLVLYWTVQNIFTIVQMKMTKLGVPGTKPPPAASAKPQKTKTR